MKRLVYALLLAAPTAINAFYATSYEPIQCPLPVPALTNGSTSISVSATETTGKWAYDKDENKAPFFEQFGTVSMADLFNGITIPTDATLTDKYFGTDTGTSLLHNGEADTPIDATLRFNDADNRYSFRSLNIGLTQHLFTGLYLQIAGQLVEQSLTQVPTATGTDADATRVTDFLNDFDNVMAEHSLPPTRSNKRSTTLERLSVLAGWSGHVPLKNSVIQSLNGSLSMGYVVTPPDFNHPLAPAALPYNISDGFIARATCHAQINSHLAADLDMSTTIYNQRNGTMHVVRDETEGDSYYSGPLLIGTGFVNKDPGNLWTLNAALSANRFAGFYASVGYQFSYQESTQLQLRDTTILRGADWTGTALHLLPALQQNRLNSDPRLGRWKHHALMLAVGFEPTTNHRVVPHFTARIYYPLMGHHTIDAPHVFAGGGQLAFQWAF